MTATRLTDRIVDDVADLIERHALGDHFTYEVQVGLVPTPGGQNLLIAQVFVLLANPIVGQGDLVALEIIPVEITKIPEALEALVKRCIGALRDQQRAALGPLS